MTEQHERELRERRELVEREHELELVEQRERDELAALRGRELMAYHRRLALEQNQRLEAAS